MTATKGRVKSHTRYVNGKRQRVRSHSRQLQPSRARLNLSRAWALLRTKHRGAALAYAGLAAAEVGAWFTLRGASLALVTFGLGATAAGVAARRATPSSPKPDKESFGSRLLDATPKELRFKRPQSSGEESPYEIGKRHGQQDRSTNWKGPFAETPTYGDGDPRSAEYEKGYSEGAGYGWQDEA